MLLLAKIRVDAALEHETIGILLNVKLKEMTLASPEDEIVLSLLTTEDLTFRLRFCGLIDVMF